MSENRTDKLSNTLQVQAVYTLRNESRNATDKLFSTLQVQGIYTHRT
jgi:hypothetical protein